MDTPTLAPGETLRLHAPAVRGAVARSGPTFRATVSVPVIQDLDLFITDRRVIVRAELFLGLFEADYVAWFPEAQRPAGTDTLKAASVATEGPLGPVLALTTTTGRPSLLRGPELKLALYLPNAPEAAALLPRAVRG